MTNFHFFVFFDGLEVSNKGHAMLPGLYPNSFDNNGNFWFSIPSQAPASKAKIIGIQWRSGRQATPATVSLLGMKRVPPTRFGSLFFKNGVFAGATRRVFFFDPFPSSRVSFYRSSKRGEKDQTAKGDVPTTV